MVKYDRNKYHRTYQGEHKDKINTRRRELYKVNKVKILKQKSIYREKQRMEGTKMNQNNGPSTQVIGHIDLIDHEITIDEYVKVTLSIPKKLTAIDLRGIMLKANQLLKMSEISIPQQPMRTNVKRGIGLVWKEGMLAELVGMIERRKDMTKSSVFKEFSTKYGMTPHDADKKYYYEQTCGRLPKASSGKGRHTGSRQRIWTEEMVNFMQTQKKDNKNIQQVTDSINEKFKLNLTQEQITSKIGNIQNRGF